MTDQIQHQNLTTGNWQKFSLAEQLGNVGSEVGRALNAEKRGKDDKKQAATVRAFELLDLTIMDARWRKRLKELVRSREVLADYFFGDNIYGSTAENLEKYFYWFALVARSGR